MLAGASTQQPPQPVLSYLSCRNKKGRPSAETAICPCRKPSTLGNRSRAIDDRPYTRTRRFLLVGTPFLKPWVNFFYPSYHKNSPKSTGHRKFICYFSHLAYNKIKALWKRIPTVASLLRNDSGVSSLNCRCEACPQAVAIRNSQLSTCPGGSYVSSLIF